MSDPDQDPPQEIPQVVSYRSPSSAPPAPPEILRPILIASRFLCYITLLAVGLTAAIYYQAPRNAMPTTFGLMAVIGEGTLKLYLVIAILLSAARMEKPSPRNGTLFCLLHTYGFAAITLLDVIAELATGALREGPDPISIGMCIGICIQAGFLIACIVIIFNTHRFLRQIRAL